MNNLSIVGLDADKIETALLKDDPYPIDFDDAWEWVGYSNKANALRVLQGSFVEGDDFSSIKRKSRGGRPGENYSLTADCFKEFCMMAGTDQGKEVRRYFIQAEKRLRSIIEESRVSKAVRRELTDSIQFALAHGHKDMHGFEYKTYTDLIYKAVLGMSAKQYREATGLDPKANVKEHITADQVSRVAKLEKMIGGLLDAGFDYEAVKRVLAMRSETSQARISA